MSQHSDFGAADLTTLRLVVGGEPVPESLIKLYNGRGVPINQRWSVYGTNSEGRR
jgi:fatty-acyl-CoA synthase